MTELRKTSDVSPTVGVAEQAKTDDTSAASLNLDTWWDSQDPQAAYFQASSEPISLTNKLRVGTTFSLTAFKHDAAIAMGPSFALELNDRHELYARFLFGTSSINEDGSNSSIIAGNYLAPWGYDRPYFNAEWQSLYLDDAWFHYVGSYAYLPTGIDFLSLFGGAYVSLGEKSVGGVAGLSSSF